jgi:hypothetical protein
LSLVNLLLMVSLVLLASLLLLIMFLASQLLQVSLLLLASQLVQASLLMLAYVMLLSLHLFCKHSSCYWLLQRRTCCCWHPTVDSIVVAGIPLFYISLLLLAFLLLLASILQLGLCKFLRTLLLLLHEYFTDSGFPAGC